MRLFWFCVALFQLLWPFSCEAAFKSARDGSDLQSAWNPQPLNDDIVLPMPCGLSLALRGVVIPSGALIRDKTFPMGIVNLENSDRQLYERRFTGHISAPFTSRDLPSAWQAKLPAKNPAGDTWYFMGKYEISRLQWQAVMQALNAEGGENPAMCPARDEKDGNLPVANVSWFEAQDFLNKYNAWLVKNHAASLPAFANTKNIGFLRLPTEEEWEYAARGGASVPPEWWEDQDFIPMADGRTIADYGVYTQANALSRPLAIGSRNPNQLGIYDTAGNVSEMVDGFFRMSIADMTEGRIERRLHGAAGGILTKGGSFRSQEEAVIPGWRDEAPLYTSSGPGRQGDLGLRIVLAGLNIPDASRLNELRREVGENKFPEAKVVDFGQKSVPEIMDELLKGTDGQLKKSLQSLQGKLADQANAEAARNSKNLEHTYRSLLYQAETLRAFAFRYSAASKEMEKIRALLKGNIDESTKKQAEKLLTEAKKDLNDYLQSMEMGASYYKASLGVIYNEPQAELSRLAAQARQEYGGSGVFNEHMRQNIDILSKYLEQAKKGGLQSLQPQAILKGILPDRHYKLLPL